MNDYNYFHIQTIPIGDFFRVNYRIIKCFWKCRVARRVEVFNHGSANGVNWFLEIRELLLKEKRQSFAMMTQSLAKHFSNVTQKQKRNWMFACENSQRFPWNLFFCFVDVPTGFRSVALFWREICIFFKGNFFKFLLPYYWWDHEVKSLAGCVTEFLLLTLAINRLRQV